MLLIFCWPVPDDAMNHEQRREKILVLTSESPQLWIYFSDLSSSIILQKKENGAKAFDPPEQLEQFTCSASWTIF